MFPQKNNDVVSLEDAYRRAILFTKSHYENFPVVSFFLPKKIYKHVAIIYQFARTADDIADDGSISAEKRLSNLHLFRENFSNALRGEYESVFWQALHKTLNEFSISETHLFNLLSAFEQDLKKNNYSTWEELLNYCSFSANPIGRIILELLDLQDEKLFLLSDKICSALQITNLIQDSMEDILNGRNYFPEEFIKKFNVNPADFNRLNFSDELRELIKYEISVLRKMYHQGSDLLNFLPYKMKIEIGATINGGLSVLKKIEEKNYDVFNNKIKLSKLDFIKIFTITFITAA